MACSAELQGVPTKALEARMEQLSLPWRCAFAAQCALITRTCQRASHNSDFSFLHRRTCATVFWHLLWSLHLLNGCTWRLTTCAKLQQRPWQSWHGRWIRHAMPAATSWCSGTPACARCRSIAAHLISGTRPSFSHACLSRPSRSTAQGSTTPLHLVEHRRQMALALGCEPHTGAAIFVQAYLSLGLPKCCCRVPRHWYALLSPIPLRAGAWAVWTRVARCAGRRRTGAAAARSRASTCQATR